jgi:hypothetical protein
MHASIRLNIPGLRDILSYHSLHDDHPQSTSHTPETINAKQAPTSLLNPDTDFLRFTLHSKATLQLSFIADIVSNLQQTKTLETLLLAYLDQNILKVENDLLQIDFWQNHRIHPDVMVLRSQMQQQLFQLEREKVKTQLQIHNQLMNLSKELRYAMKQLNELELHQILFTQNGRPLQIPWKPRGWP